MKHILSSLLLSCLLLLSFTAKAQTTTEGDTTGQTATITNNAIAVKDAIKIFGIPEAYAERKFPLMYELNGVATANPEADAVGEDKTYSNPGIMASITEGIYALSLPSGFLYRFIDTLTMGADMVGLISGIMGTLNSKGMQPTWVAITRVVIAWLFFKAFIPAVGPLALYMSDLASQSILKGNVADGIEGKKVSAETTEMYYITVSTLPFFEAVDRARTSMVSQIASIDEIGRASCRERVYVLV